MRTMWVACLALAGLVGTTNAEPKKNGELFVSPCVKPFDQWGSSPEAKAETARQLPLVGRSVMVTLMLDGKIVRQRELKIDRFSGSIYPFRDLPHGRYSVKMEAEGVETVLKEGLVVNEANSPAINADLVAGKGLRIIRYGEDARTVSELEAKLKALQEELAQLKDRK